MGFICREGGAKKSYCHLLKAENEKMVSEGTVHAVKGEKWEGREEVVKGGRR